MDHLHATEPAIVVTDPRVHAASDVPHWVVPVAWLASLLVLLFALGTPPVTRTQEARVLETARETLGRSRDEGLRAWLVPYCNGQLRLQKPPLAYWLSAASFRLFGVNEWSGRLPAALAGWLTLGVTMWLAAHVFRSRAVALWTGGVLLGSFLFFRHSRLAETDVLVTLFVTLAIASTIKGLDNPPCSTSWYVISGVAVGIILLAKNANVAFPLLFFAAVVVLEHRWRELLRWTLSGAPIVAIVLGTPWWIYVLAKFGTKVFGDEAEVLFEGRNHPGWFWEYGPMLLKATLPWCGFVVAALVTAVRWSRRRRSAPLRRLLVWIAVILLPLCVVGNKQEHYLLPLMPPLAMLTGWWIAIAARRPFARAARLIFAATFTLTVFAALALPIVARRARRETLTTDIILFGILLVALIDIELIWRRRDWRAALVRYAALILLMLGPLLSVWSPTLRTVGPRQVAAQIRARGGDGPYCFYGENFSLPLVFAMRKVIPVAKDSVALEAVARSSPQLVVVAQTKSDREPPPVPDGFEQIDEIRSDDQRFEVYRKR